MNRRYWDLPTDDINYSYVKSAVDEYGYSTLAIDRFGIGKSSVADPMNTVQAPAAMLVFTKLSSYYSSVRNHALLIPLLETLALRNVFAATFQSLKEQG